MRADQTQLVVDLPETEVCREEELVRDRVEQLLGQEEAVVVDKEAVVVVIKGFGYVSLKKDRLTISISQTLDFCGAVRCCLRIIYDSAY